MKRPKKSAPLAQTSIPFDVCLAKTFTSPTSGETVPGRSVLEHCQIVGEVAREIIARYPPALAKALFPPDAHMAAAAHDIGKISPYFAEKIRRACAPMTCSLPAQLHLDPDLESEWGGHAGVSQVAAKALGAPERVPVILGQHHGFSPPVATRTSVDDVFGGPSWQSEREKLVEELMSRLACGWPDVPSASTEKLLSGLASVSDWIGSGEHFEDPSLPHLENIHKALDAAGFIHPAYKSGLSFQDIFGFAPNIMQDGLLKSVDTPGVYVLEAPMGLGKTEAALYAAYKMVSSGQACGIYFALPTQLTSNKIHERFTFFLDSVLDPTCKHRALLLHSGAWLMDTEMGEDGRPGGAWFDSSKRGLLAPFAVGTVDQALMAAMRVKHGFVRAFGLAGKVVILDEVHTYDAYTGCILNSLVSLLRSLHCTVIILTATLTHDRRAEMVAGPLKSSGYPLITASKKEASVIEEIPVQSEADKSVAVKIVESDSLAIEEVIKRAADGEQIIWIENSVKEAQSRYFDLSARLAELNIPCGLLHSRFTVSDRQKIEAEWVGYFGKSGQAGRMISGRVLIGTQILEQSLDIDCDFMVSRFAPSDMLLQRIGRLWRHAGTPRSPFSKREVWFLAPDLPSAITDPLSFFGSSAYVYSPYVLCRSLEVWSGLSKVNLPSDVRGIIEKTYAAKPEKGFMARWLYELDKGTPRRAGREALRSLSRVALAADGNTLPESRAQTRYSETSSVDVLVLKSVEQSPESESCLLTTISGDILVLPWKKTKLSRQQWRQLAVRLSENIVSAPVYLAPPETSVDLLNSMGLQNCFYIGKKNHAESILRVALVDEHQKIVALSGKRLENSQDLRYRTTVGYSSLKDEFSNE